MKKLTTFFAALCICAQMSAVPAKPVKRTVQQSDGTTLTIVLHGDENFHFYSTLDGVPVMENADGTFSYATIQDGRLAASNRLAHNSEARTTEETSFVGSVQRTVKSHINTTWTQRAEKRNQHRIKRAEKRRAQASKAPRRAGSSMTGNKKGLVIMVNFTDKSCSHTQTEFQQRFNKEGYNKDQHIGSVRDYFHDQSYGQLTIDFDVVGPYTLKNKMAYYGGNNSQGDDKAPEEMVLEAIKAADADVNYKDYDWDGDGEVDQVYVIYAGYGEAAGGSSNTVWPHEWQLSAALSNYPNGIKLDGVTIDTYACSSELSGGSGSRMDGIGTACHEFSHCLGLPDFYDTNNTNFGMAEWSVMDAGCYNGPIVGQTSFDGCIPCAYSAYERFFAGWITPTVLNEGTYISGMKAITDAPEAYIIYNEANKNEYYLLQNIQLTSWNKCAYGHGMLVIHVDYDESAWAYNEVNNTSSRQRCTVIPADNSLKMDYYQGYYYSDTKDLPGDPYPGTSNNHSLTNTSAPAATLYNKNKDGKKLMNKPIEDIQEANGLISFSFNGGEQIPTPNTPVATEATNITENGFTANWNVVEGAETYTIELTEKSTSPLSGTTLLEEDFTGFDQMTNMNTDLSASLDTYTDQPGWKGSKVFGGKAVTPNGFGVRLGSSQMAGSITSPLLPTPATGEVEITFKAGPWNANNAASFTVSITNEAGIAIDSVTFTISEQEELTYTTNVTEPFHVVFRTNSKGYRMFLADLFVYNDEKPANAPRRASVKNTIEGITTNSYTLTELTGQKYTYRIKALANGKESEWSNPITVVLPEIIDAIEQRPWEDGTVEVYNPSGLFLRRTSITNWQNGLPQGIYILKSAGSTHKVMK